ncbi:MAG: hypothetical protein KatS3mg011_0492 [Acidimicrobiia bacterium]|nr:MAG: hypothetical protein KatS3mg011_0492 [Acidimicrobiia bacterium]
MTDGVAALVAAGFGALVGWGLAGRHPDERGAVVTALAVALVAGVVFAIGGSDDRWPYADLSLLVGSVAAGAVYLLRLARSQSR